MTSLPPTNHKLPLDDKDGLIITLSVTRKGAGHEARHFLEGEHLQSEGELKNIAQKAAKILWEEYNIKDV